MIGIYEDASASAVLPMKFMNDANNVISPFHFSANIYWPRDLHAIYDYVSVEAGDNVPFDSCRITPKTLNKKGRRCEGKNKQKYSHAIAKRC